MAAFTQIVEQASDILWNYLLLFLLVGTGIYAASWLASIALYQKREVV